MDLIVTHTNADFDALASCLAAKKLYPQAEVVLPGIPERSVKNFLTMNRYLLKLRKERSNPTKLRG
jgi:nanoRNase/pAp phosphatase (c-di-AMP/oligoRNAs hydrolase)